MPKSLLEDLKNLAQEILQWDEEVELSDLRLKALDLFEKITILNHQNKLKVSSEKVKDEKLIVENLKMEQISEKEKTESFSEDVEEKRSETSGKELISDKPVDINELFIPTFDSIKEDMSQKEEFKDTISIEETERFFERKRIEKIQKKATNKLVERDSKQLSLHDKLLGNTIQIGLNDRIAFVNNLFNFSQADFNKVLGTLNDFENRKEAFDFVNYTVKSKYNWKGKEDLVERFLTIIERKFL